MTEPTSPEPTQAQLYISGARGADRLVRMLTYCDGAFQHVGFLDVRDPWGLDECHPIEVTK